MGNTSSDPNLITQRFPIIYANGRGQSDLLMGNLCLAVEKEMKYQQNIALNNHQTNQNIGGCNAEDIEFIKNSFFCLKPYLIANTNRETGKHAKDWISVTYSLFQLFINYKPFLFEFERYKNHWIKEVFFCAIFFTNDTTINNNNSSTNTNEISMIDKCCSLIDVMFEAWETPDIHPSKALFNYKIAIEIELQSPKLFFHCIQNEYFHCCRNTAKYNMSLIQALIDNLVQHPYKNCSETIFHIILWYLSKARFNTDSEFNKIQFIDILRYIIEYIYDQRQIVIENTQNTDDMLMDIDSRQRRSSAKTFARNFNFSMPLMKKSENNELLSVADSASVNNSSMIPIISEYHEQKQSFLRSNSMKNMQSSQKSNQKQSFALLQSISIIDKQMNIDSLILIELNSLLINMKLLVLNFRKQKNMSENVEKVMGGHTFHLHSQLMSNYPSDILHKEIQSIIDHKLQKEYEINKKMDFMKMVVELYPSTLYYFSPFENGCLTPLEFAKKVLNHKNRFEKLVIDFLEQSMIDNQSLLSKDDGCVLARNYSTNDKIERKEKNIEIKNSESISIEDDEKYMTSTNLGIVHSIQTPPELSQSYASFYKLPQTSTHLGSYPSNITSMDNISIPVQNTYLKNSKSEDSIVHQSNNDRSRSFTTYSDTNTPTKVRIRYPQKESENSLIQMRNRGILTPTNTSNGARYGCSTSSMSGNYGRLPSISSISAAVHKVRNIAEKRKTIDGHSRTQNDYKCKTIAKHKKGKRKRSSDKKKKKKSKNKSKSIGSDINNIQFRQPINNEQNNSTIHVCRGDSNQVSDQHLQQRTKFGLQIIGHSSLEPILSKNNTLDMQYIQHHQQQMQPEYQMEREFTSDDVLLRIEILEDENKSLKRELYKMKKNVRQIQLLLKQYGFRHQQQMNNNNSMFVHMNGSGGYSSSALTRNCVYQQRRIIHGRVVNSKGLDINNIQEGDINQSMVNNVLNDNRNLM